MNELWNALAAQVAAHLIEIEAGVAALLISFVFSLPEQFPRHFQDFWTIFRDTLQGAIPLKYVKTVHANPTPPAEPAQEK